MAERNTIHVGVRGFALQKLKDFGADSRVLEAYRRQLAEVEITAEENRPFHTRLYYTIQGLGSCGREALAELEGAEALLRQTRFRDRPESQLAGQYRSALRESRSMIAAHAAVISRSRTGNGAN